MSGLTIDDLRKSLNSLPKEPPKQWRYLIIHPDTLDVMLDQFSEHGWIVTDEAADDPFGAKYTHVIKDWYTIAVPEGEFFMREYTMIVREHVEPGQVYLIEDKPLPLTFRGR